MSELWIVCIDTHRLYNLDIEYVSLDIYGVLKIMTNRYSTRDVFRVELPSSTSQLAVL